MADISRDRWEWRPVGELNPYAKNAKKHDKKQIANVANSIKRFGWVQPIVTDANGEVIIGHCRLLAAKQIGLDKVPVLRVDWLSEDEVRELRIADNKTNESPWDNDLLSGEIADLSFDGFDFDFDIPAVDAGGQEYTDKTMIPQYDIVGESPVETDLYDSRKTEALIEEINGHEMPEEIKQFLIYAAHRHTVFNYRRIAEYYANAPEDIQDLMERSALVIIDYDDAIANGYATLTADIGDMLSGVLDAEG